MDDTTFKVVAKRDKQNGLISSMLVAVGGVGRSLIFRQEQVDETEYRRAVCEFETGYLPKGVLSAPQVISLAEWRHRAQDESFPETPFDLQGPQ